MTLLSLLVGHSFFRVNAHRANNTEEDFKAALEPNLQCSFLVKSKEHVGEKCQELADFWLWNTMDWISTTADFDRQLLPLVAYLAKIQYREYQHDDNEQSEEGQNGSIACSDAICASQTGFSLEKNTNVIQPPGFHSDIPLLENLSMSTTTSLQQKTQIDRGVLYLPAMDRFDFANWKKFLDSKNATIPCRWKRTGPSRASTSLFGGTSRKERKAVVPTSTSDFSKQQRVDETTSDGLCEYQVARSTASDHRNSYPTGQLPPTSPDGVYMF